MVEIGFTIAFVLLAIPLVALELYGVWRKEKGDTISENIWWLQKRFWPFRIVVAAFCLWLLIHFGFDGNIM